MRQFKAWEKVMTRYNIGVDSQEPTVLCQSFFWRKGSKK